jgi:GT2 family glycosyltransferase
VTVAALTVTWRDCDDTLETLDSLAAMDPAPDHLICVAQELDPRALERLLSASPPGTTTIELDSNLGFAAAANLGIERACGLDVEYVLLVNNDATVTSDCLRHCLSEAHSDSRIAAVGPAIAFTDTPSELWYGGGRHSHLFGFTMHRGLRRPTSDPPPSADTDYIPGCCVLLSVAAWLAIGPFRVDYFMYHEDAEWGARARAAGWRLRYLGKVLCQHAVGVSSRQRGSLGLNENTAYYLGRNHLRFALDTPTRALRTSRVLGTLIIWSGYNAWRIVQSRRLAVGRSYLRGLRDAARGRMGPRPT